MNLTAKCIYPYVAPKCTFTISTIAPNYATYQVAFGSTGALLMLALGWKLEMLRRAGSTTEGSIVQRRILLLLFCAAVTAPIKALDPNGLGGYVPFIAFNIVSSSATSFIFSACIVMVAFWMQLMASPSHATSSRACSTVRVFRYGLLMSVWCATLAFPTLTWYHWGQNEVTTMLYLAELACTFVHMVVVCVAATVFGLQVHRRLLCIQQQLEAGLARVPLPSPLADFKPITASYARTSRAPSTPSSQPMTSSSCFQSKVLRAVVGIFALTLSVLALQIVTAVRYKAISATTDQVKVCLSDGCTTFRMPVPIMGVAQLLCIGGGVWIFI